MKIALVHDYLREYGGAERVVEVLHEIYPDAPLFTSFVDWKALGIHADRFRDWDIRTSWAQNFLMKKWHSPLRFLTPWVWKYFDFSEFDVVISSSGWFISRGIDTPKETVHISYIHHPPRNLYGYETGRLARHPLVKAYAAMINPFLRYYDFQAAQKPDYLLANSKETQRRIQKFYRRETMVVYPPIEINPKSKILNPKQIQNSKLKIQNNIQHTQYDIPDTKYYLSVGRITGAKHVDLIVDTFRKLGKSLVVVGTGNDSKMSNVKAQMSNVQFLGAVNDEQLWQYYAGAKALIFAASDEDFGMVPVEAMAAGTPVIAYRSGGVVESVVAEETGVFFDKLTPDALIAAIKHFDNSINRSEKRRRQVAAACRRRAQRFSKERFEKEMRKFVTKAVKHA